MRLVEALQDLVLPRWHHRHYDLRAGQHL
jgi:hypothetical protein